MKSTTFLVLRLDAPLMSFGGSVVDNFGVTRDFPAASMLTGLVANALGWDHRDGLQLNRLQKRLVFGSRRDRVGRALQDFQSVALGQPHLLSSNGWTTRGVLEGREGGVAKTGTHLRYRDYIADALYTVVLTLVERDESPSLSEVEVALQEPERPLFLGRKACLPASPIFRGSLQAPSVYAALEAAPRSARTDPGALAAWWPADDRGGSPDRGRTVPVVDERDWRNQIHVGRRVIRHGLIGGPT